MASKLFDQLASIWQSDEELTTEVRPDSVYMANRFLSLHPAGFLAAYECNKAHGLPEWAALPFLKHSTPKMKAPFNKYPKQLVAGVKLNDRGKMAVERLCKKFNISEAHGIQTYTLLKMQGVNVEAD